MVGGCATIAARTGLRSIEREQSKHEASALPTLARERPSLTAL